MSEAEVYDAQFILSDPNNRQAEFKERSLKPEYIQTQLKLFYNDCDRRSIHLLKKADRYRRYSWITLGVSVVLGCAAFPFLYWIRAKEYTVQRQRKPLRVKNFLIMGISLVIGSVGSSMFASSNIGFGFQARAMMRFASAYDELAWEAKKFQYQLAMETFSSGKFMLSRKLEYQIDDEETNIANEEETRRKKVLGIKDEETHFSELLLKDEVEEAREQEQVVKLRKDERKKVFKKRAFEEKLTPVSIAYYEFSDKKQVLDEWY